MDWGTQHGLHCLLIDVLSGRETLALGLLAQSLNIVCTAGTNLDMLVEENCGFALALQAFSAAGATTQVPSPSQSSHNNSSS
jgi:hypothetical protein